MTELTFTADRKSAVHSAKPNDSTNKNSATTLKATEVADGEFL